MEDNKNIDNGLAPSAPRLEILPPQEPTIEIIPAIPNHHQVRQSASTMALNAGTAIDTGMGRIMAKYGDTVYSFPTKATPGREASQKKLINYCIEQITNPRTDDGRKFTFYATYFWERCGYKKSNFGAMAGLMVQDLDRISHAQIKGIEKKNGKPTAFGWVNVFSSIHYEKRTGRVIGSFSPEFADACLDRSKMYLPDAAYQLNPHKSPNGWSLTWYIYFIKHMNTGKANEDIYSVTSLLAVCPYIPTKEQVMKKDRALNQKIVKPFYLALKSCADMFDYETVLPDGELALDDVKDYDLLIQCNIQIWFKVDPYPIKREEVKQAIADHEQIAAEAAHYNEVQAEAKRQRHNESQRRSRAKKKTQ